MVMILSGLIFKVKKIVYVQPECGTPTPTGSDFRQDAQPAPLNEKGLQITQDKGKSKRRIPSPPLSQSINYF
jgi:hypothetical protein